MLEAAFFMYVELSACLEITFAFFHFQLICCSLTERQEEVYELNQIISNLIYTHNV